MDFTTHLTTGAFLAAGLARGHNPEVPVAAAVLGGALLPDLDAGLYVINPGLYFRYHRIITHTLVATPLLAAGLAWLIVALGGGRRFWALFGYALLGLLVHNALYTLTRYPLRFLLPFSDANQAIGLVPFHDPYIKGIALVGFLVVFAVPGPVAGLATAAGLLGMGVRVAAAYLGRGPQY
ncbi:MAG: metal-dependent hydrolase [Deltaproteobacteria bacterium]|nr:metal-dependent hydrolase [Deltaproteobacteria bacterium]